MTKGIPREIVVASTNVGKAAELQRMLGDYGVAIRGLAEFGPLEAAAENGASFAENARQKAQHYGILLNRWVLADDSGLEVEALGRAPGVYSSRFAGAESTDPSERDRANNAKLLALMADVPAAKRGARFCCCLCLCDSREVVLEVKGVLEGVIATEARGNNGFGYDAVFCLPELDKTVAELSAEEKNGLSHRGKAVRELRVRLETLLHKGKPD